MALVDLQPAANAFPDLANLPDVTDDLDDLFRPLEASIDAAATQDTRRPSSPKRSRVDELGIDEEIQVAKRRKPVAKLDEDRLLSQNGIPKLRRIVQEKLKFKGKGHEFSDVSRMLNLYQLWLDDLYPRAKFADGLVMIEKLGHSKRMAVMRKEWVKENKVSTTGRETGSAGETEDISRTADAGGENLGRENATRSGGDEEDSLFVGGANVEDDVDLPDEDELDTLLADPSTMVSAMAESHADTVREPKRINEPEKPDNGFEDQYAEEMRMMADMENW